MERISGVLYTRTVHSVGFRGRGELFSKEKLVYLIVDALYEFIGVVDGFVFKGGFLSVTLFQQDLLQELSRGPG